MALHDASFEGDESALTALVKGLADDEVASEAKPSLHRQHWVEAAGGGDISKLSLQSGDIDEPRAGELSIRVEAIGLNCANVFSGGEISGVVERIGVESTTDALQGEAQIKHGGQLPQLSPAAWEQALVAARAYSVGDRVMGASRVGFYSTLLNIPAHQVRRVPETWSAQQAAAFPVQTLTAHYALKKLGAVRPSQAVLVHSCAGGTGMQAVELCHRTGAFVVGTVGSAEKVAVLLARFPKLNRQQLIVRDASMGPKSFAAQLEAALAFLRASTQDESIDGFDCVLDGLMGDVFQPGLKALRSTGRYIVYGAASMTPREDKVGLTGWVRLAWQYLWRPRVDPFAIMGENKSVMGFNLIHCLNDAKLLTTLFEELEALDLPPPHVGNTFKFHELVQALRLLKSGATTGKVVITV